MHDPVKSPGLTITPATDYGALLGCRQDVPGAWLQPIGFRIDFNRTDPGGPLHPPTPD
jgi:hypothetical protein